MRIEEVCSCGASLVIVPETSAYRLEENQKAVKEAWRQVTRWRDVHSACRQPPKDGKP